MRSKYFLAAAVMFPLAFAAEQASAITVSSVGSGQFSNITGCNAVFPAPGCSISSTGGGTNNFLDMSGFNNSTLTADRISQSINVPPNANDVTVGRLTWVNNASTNTDQDFNVNYTFTLAFSSPNGSSDSQTFTLEIQQTNNPQGDNILNISNTALAGLGPFSLTGVAVSDIHFVLSGSGTYNGTNWTNPEDHTSQLLIVADFTATTVPEPVSMSLLGTGLVGLGLARRRARQAA